MTSSRPRPRSPAPETGGSFTIRAGGGVAGRPPGPARSVGRGRRRPATGWSSATDFRSSRTSSGHPDRGYHELADRLAADTGWVVLTFSFRGISQSSGNFSLGGWLADLKAATDVLLQTPGVDGVWACGFAAGGALALCAAGEDPRIRGVAAFSAPADFARAGRGCPPLRDPGPGRRA